MPTFLAPTFLEAAPADGASGSASGSANGSASGSASGTGGNGGGAATPPGRVVFEAEKCHLCHGAAAAGIEPRTRSENLKGPDLSGYSTDDFEALAAYLRRQAERQGELHRRALAGSDEELRTLLDWLSSLEPSDDEPSAAGPSTGRSGPSPRS